MKIIALLPSPGKVSASDFILLHSWVFFLSFSFPFSNAHHHHHPYTGLVRIHLLTFVPRLVYQSSNTFTCVKVVYGVMLSRSEQLCGHVGKQNIENVSVCCPQTKTVTKIPADHATAGAGNNLQLTTFKPR